MPRIPPTLPQEPLQVGGTRGFSAPRVAPPRSATGTQIRQAGQALQAVGSAASDIGSQQQDDIDNAKNKQAFNLLDQRINEVYYDSESGYMNKIGVAAGEDSRAQALKDIEDEATKLLGGLDNETQRGLFQLKVDQRMTDVQRQVQVHFNKQTHIHHMGEARQLRDSLNSAGIEAQLSAAKQEGDERATAEKAAAKNKADALVQANILADGLGMGDAQRANLIQETTTAFHEGVVRRMVNTNAPEAAEYLAGVDPKELTPKARNDLQRLTRRASLNDRAGNLAGDIVEQVEAGVDQADVAQEPEGAAEAEQQAPAGIGLKADRLKIAALQNLAEQDIPDDLRQATRQRINQAAALRAAQEAADDSDLMIEAQALLVSDPTMGPTQLPPEMIERLVQGGMWASVNQFARSGRKSENPQARGRILDAPDEAFLRIGSKSELQRALLLEGASPSTIALGMARFDDVRAPPDVQGDPLWPRKDRLRTTAIRAGLLRQPGKGKKPSTFEQEARYDDIEEVANRRLKEAERAAGHDLFGDELQAVYDSVITDLVYSRGDPAVFAALTPEEAARSETVVGDTRINTFVADAIRANLELAGEPPTDENVLKFFRQKGSPANIDEFAGVRGRTLFERAVGDDEFVPPRAPEPIR